MSTARSKYDDLPIHVLWTILEFKAFILLMQLQRLGRAERRHSSVDKLLEVSSRSVSDLDFGSY
jgi:hypothetical protein